NAAPRPAPRSLIQNQVQSPVLSPIQSPVQSPIQSPVQSPIQSPVQKPISLVSPGPAVVPVSVSNGCLKPPLPQAVVQPEDRGFPPSQPWFPPQQSLSKRRA
ncbi:tetra-peptide repeat homeobox protein 1-like, partial [Seriola lalandi dorsalis]|uniref:tetra-peptide repeat homeobox protein 1-like n=1 Tax=Seriola lalandi dorsalis TaxID=1841481 RepID=UPI000C6F564E